MKQQSRRTFIKLAAASSALFATGTTKALVTPTLLRRPIPKSGELIPAIGMGTWVTFNVGDNISLRDQRTDVLKTFFDLGGGMIDSSPMYGSAEDVMGYSLAKLSNTQGMLSATKIWTSSKDEGRSQINDSFRLWGLKKFDLFQVHKLLNWEEHLDTLRERRAAGQIRYIGITTSHGSRHSEMARTMETQDIDFVQFTYNVEDRDAEDRLLPLAADKGIAVIINRPFQRGTLTNRFEGKPLPTWASEYGITSWAQYLLKFVVSHPAVTCAIPATSKVEHMKENMNVLQTRLPDIKDRQRMLDYVQSL